MDLVGWIVVGVVVAATGVLVGLAPVLKRDHRRRQLEGRAPSGGLGSGLDTVWRPAAEDAHREWEAQVELPAPAPAPGDKGRVANGRIVIDLRDEA
jgi:hypothetical protein